MRLPVLNQRKSKYQDKVSFVNAFLGLNKGLNIADSEFEAMENMTTDYYPVFSTRKKRGVFETLTKPLGICGGDKLIYVDDNKLYIDRTQKLALSSTDKERQLVMMGAYLCIFPDGIVYNTLDDTHETINNEVTTSTAVTMRMCKLDGTEFTSSNTHVGTTAPSNTTIYPYWLDTSVPDNVVLKMWSDTYSMWNSVATTYVKISATGIGEGFNDYDSAKFSGIGISGYNNYNFNDNLIIYKASDDYLIVAGLMDLYYTQNDPVTVKRELPMMDYVCELNNRIYGCRYGSNNAGEFVNEIYASKLGDPKNWFAYAGLSSDSYAASCGSEGEFTGIAAYQGYLFFFKEDGFHKLYGTEPSNFQMIYRPGRGVAQGCYKSIAVVNQILFYKSRDAIVAYDGSENIISTKLGLEPYYDAVAVGYRNKYYISMRDKEYNYKMFVFDVAKATWCIEDNLHVKYMTYADNATYVIDYDNRLLCINEEDIYDLYFPHEIVNESNRITVSGVDYDSQYNFPNDNVFPGPIERGSIEGTLEWSFTTGDLGLDNPYNKYLKRVHLRMQQEANSKVKIEIEYDSSGEYEYVTELYSPKKRSFDIPISVKRADHVKLRISGWGEYKLYSITKIVESGSGEDEADGI